LSAASALNFKWCQKLCLSSGTYSVQYTIYINSVTLNSSVISHTEPSLLECCWLGNRKAMRPVQSTATTAPRSLLK